MKTILLTYLIFVLAGAIPFTCILKGFVKDLQKDKDIPVLPVVLLFT